MKIDEKIKAFVQKILNTGIGLAVIGITLIFIVGFSSVFVYVKPYEYGIKQVKIGFERGIQDKVYAPGFHFIIPFMEAMHTFPRDIQVFDLTNNLAQVTSTFHDKAAHIQTSDGFFVDVDVSILFHITDPVKVIRTIGLGDLYFTNGILPKAEPVLKDALGTLTTEEFYNPHLRVEKMMAAKEKLHQDLQEKGIGIDHVLVRYFKYSDEIQNNIEEKKLKDQLVFKNQAEARAAKEAALLAKMEQEGKELIKIELEKGKAYQQTQLAEKELYSRTKHAKADLLIQKAEAYRTKLKNSALKGIGSENLVGLEMAKVLEGVELIILPSSGANGVNPLDLEKTRAMFD